MNLPTSYEIAEFFFTGICMILIILGWVNSYRRPKSLEETLRDENEALIRKNKRLSGHCGRLQDVNTFLQGKQNQSERRERGNQLSRAKLNEELVRQKKFNRTLKRENQELRKRKGRR